MPSVATKPSNDIKKTAKSQASSEGSALDIAFSVPEHEHAWGISLLQATASIVTTYINRHGIAYENLEDLIETVRGALSK